MTAPTRRQRRAIVALVVLSLTLITADLRSDSLAGLRDGTRSAFGPVEDGINAVLAPIGRFLSGIPDIGRSRDRITELEGQNAELRRRLRESTLTGSRATELERLKLLAGQGQYRVVPATVVSVGPSLGFEWSVTVDAGSRDGVRPDQTVVNGDGLVGRVKQVTAGTAVVVLLIDPKSAAGVRLAGSDQLGLASGGGLGPLTFSPLDPQVRAKVSDRLVTGPWGGSTYVAGVPVGEVTAVSGDPGAPAQEATVTPYVRFASLDLVGIVLAGPRTDPRDSVLPTRPAPSPSAATRSAPAGSTPATGTTPTRASATGTP